MSDWKSRMRILVDVFGTDGKYHGLFVIPGEACIFDIAKIAKKRDLNLEIREVRR